jgi:hypothetical protein
MILLHMNVFIEAPPEYDLKCSFRFTNTAELSSSPEQIANTVGIAISAQPKQVR